MKAHSLGILALSLTAAACSSSSGGRPALGPSASQPAYAIKYADELSSTTRSFGDHVAEEKQLSAGFVVRVDELKKPDWAEVRAIVDKADDSGKTVSYAEAHAEIDAVRAFWNEEHDGVNAKVSANAQYAAKQASCTADVGGAATFALKEAVDKALEKRLRARNDAFVVIERYRASLGKENAATLEKLADEIAQASYVVHAELPEERERLRRRVADKSAVAATLDRFIQDEHAFQAEAGRTDADKKASEERIAAATKSKAELENASAQADETVKSIDARIEAAQKDYDDQLAALRAKIEEKKKAG